MPGFAQTLIPNNEQVSEAMTSGDPFVANPTYHTGGPRFANPWQYLFGIGRMADPAEPFLRMDPSGGPSYEPMSSVPVPAAPPMDAAPYSTGPYARDIPDAVPYSTGPYLRDAPRRRR